VPNKEAERAARPGERGPAVHPLVRGADLAGTFVFAFQGALGKPSSDDLRDLRAWLLPRYRQLLLEVARSMVTTHKRAPGSYEDNNLELKAEDLVSVNVPECSTTPNFLSESELRHSMRGAGLSSKFITGQIAEMRRARAEQQKAE